MVLMTTRGNRRNTSSKKGRRKSSTVARMSFLHRFPKWAWWIGGLLIVGVYIWLFYYFFVSPTYFRWRALYGDAKYPQGYEIHGIDISHHQGEIDWEKLCDAKIMDYPLRFVIIKSTEGSTILDKRFRENFTNARKCGFVRGAYHFWSVKSSARKQAFYFLDKVHLTEGDLPPILDIEQKRPEQSVEEFQQDVLQWLHIVEDRYHVKPIIYTYHKFKESYLNDPKFDDYPYWIAHYYVEKIEYQGQWKFWQHTDVGRLPGIDRYVDLDVYNGSYYDLLNLCIPAKGEKEFFLEGRD